MSTMTLLPCPFCGGEPEIVRAQDEDGRFAAVGCPHCGAGSRQHYFVGDDAVPHVVSAWNRRAHLAKPAQAVDVGALVEAIASEWDGCEYEGVGEHIDIGAAIRRKARAIGNAQADD